MMKINGNFENNFSLRKVKPRESFNDFYKQKRWVDWNNKRFGDDLLKRCFIIRQLWEHGLSIPMDVLEGEFRAKFGDDDVSRYVKEIEIQGLVSVKDNMVCATDNEINRVRIPLTPVFYE